MNTLDKFPYLASFVAGIMTFLSPCILPLIPAYISFITGATLDELKSDKKTLGKSVLNSLFFVLGFSLIFILLGASFSYVGSFVGGKRDIIRWAGGIIVIIFGLHVAGVFTIPFLNFQKKIQAGKSSLNYAGAFLVGITFAVGWTPCVGPILSSILILASAQGTLYKGVILLAIYSLGIGIPFIITAVFINWALSFFNKIKKYYRVIEILSGLILVIVGIMIITNSLNRLTGYFMRIFS